MVFPQPLASGHRLGVDLRKAGLVEETDDNLAAAGDRSAESAEPDATSEVTAASQLYDAERPPFVDLAERPPRVPRRTPEAATRAPAVAAVLAVLAAVAACLLLRRGRRPGRGA